MAMFNAKTKWASDKQTDQLNDSLFGEPHPLLSSTKGLKKKKKKKQVEHKTKYQKDTDVKQGKQKRKLDRAELPPTDGSSGMKKAKFSNGNDCKSKDKVVKNPSIQQSKPTKKPKSPKWKKKDSKDVLQQTRKSALTTEAPINPTNNKQKKRKRNTQSTAESNEGSPSETSQEAKKSKKTSNKKNKYKHLIGIPKWTASAPSTESETPSSLQKVHVHVFQASSPVQTISDSKTKISKPQKKKKSLSKNVAKVTAVSNSTKTQKPEKTIQNPAPEKEEKIKLDKTNAGKGAKVTAVSNSTKTQKPEKTTSIQSPTPQKEKKIKLDKTNSDKTPKKVIKSPFSVDKLKSMLDKDDRLSVKISESDVSANGPPLGKQGENASKKSKKNAAPQSLNEKMKEQLKAARFRYLNEQLYTQTGDEALSLFSEDQEAFEVYHEGFQYQVAKWPVNPVDRMIAYIQKRPKTHVVADFGCGDATIARSIVNKVHSFDLVALNSHVTVCDIADVPLKDESIDIGIFCLALMGTNLVEFLQESNRVLKTGGTLLIAEVISRFEKVGSFVRKMDKLGFSLKEKNDTNKMFIWFEFRKTSNVTCSPLPQIDLSPCLYKRR